jgi:hypothetical protein
VDIYINMPYIEDTLSISVPKMRRLAAWVKTYLQNHHKSTRTRSGAGTFYIPDDCGIIDELISTSNVSGIYLDMHVVKSFLVENKVYLFPWVGVLETSSKCDIRRLFTSPGFLTSMSMCKAIFGFTDTALSVINSLLSTTTAGREIVTRKISLPITPHCTQFDIDSWLSHPVVINTESGTPVYIPSPSQHNIVVLCSPSPPLLGQILTAVSQCQPVILSRSVSALDILGDTYPLYMEEISPQSIMAWLSQPPDVLRELVTAACAAIRERMSMFKSPTEMVEEMESVVREKG